jgi:hypothetical protein
MVPGCLQPFSQTTRREARVISACDRRREVVDNAPRGSADRLRLQGTVASRSSTSFNSTSIVN